MTKEEKQLLLKDLCARLPYGLQIHITSDECDDSFRSSEFDNTLRYHHLEAFVCDRIEIKPYLRPMSSMTEGEEDEYMIARQKDIAEAYIHATPQNAIDWLNEHNFDYRGLIDKGLALEAPEGMYNKN